MSNRNEQEQWPDTWKYRLLAALHFLRVVGLLTVLLVEIFGYAIYSTSIDPLALVGFPPMIYLDLLFGFLILVRKKITNLLYLLLPVVIYVTLLGFPFLMMSLVSPIPLFISLLGFSFVIEMFLIAFLGLLWLKREWVNQPSD